MVHKPHYEAYYKNKQVYVNIYGEKRTKFLSASRKSGPHGRNRLAWSITVEFITLSFNNSDMVDDIKRFLRRDLNEIS